MAKLEEHQQQIQQLLAEREETSNIIKGLAADKASTNQQIQFLQDLDTRNQAMGNALSSTRTISTRGAINNHWYQGRNKLRLPWESRYPI